MNTFASVTRRVFLLLLCFIVTSCSDGDSNFSATSGGDGGAPVPQTGTLRIENVLARAVPSMVTQMRISGFDSSDRVVFGPVTVAKAAVVVLEEVPIAVVRVQIEYLVNGRVVGIGSSPVAIAPGQVTSLVDPDFLSLEEELLSLTVTPANASIPRGTSQQLAVTGTFSDQSQVDLSTVVVWRSSDPAVAPVSETGLARGLVTGSTTLTATLSGVVGSATLTVTDAALSTMTISPLAPSIADGTMQAFAITGNFSDGTSRSLTGQAALSSSNAAATIDSATGVATAVDPGQSTITASFQGVTASTTLTVTAATLTSIAVTPDRANLPSGLNLQYTATGTFSDGNQQDLSGTVVWSSSLPTTANINSIGLATAGTPGTTTIGATMQGVAGQANLTVSAASLSSISISPLAPSIADGTTQAFTVTGLYSDGSSRSLVGQATLSSSNQAASTIDSSTGVATGVDPGPSTITASFQGVMASTTLTVTAATLVSIAVTPADIDLPSGLTQEYKAMGTFTDGDPQDLTSMVIWSSTVQGTATIDATGLAIAGTPGTTTIKATQTTGGVVGQTGLTVSDAVMVGLKVLPATPSIPAGLTQAFTAEAIYSNLTSAPVTAAWTSSATNVAIIDPATGLATTAAAAVGQTTITATAHGFSSTTILTVTTPTITSIAIDPPVGLSAPGATKQYRAIATLDNNTSQDVTDQATWSSNDTDVVIANDNIVPNRIGRAVVDAAAATGQTVIITATFGSFTPATSILTLNLFVYVTEQTSISVRKFNTIAGALATPVSFPSGSPGPISIAVHPSGRYALVGGSQGGVDSFTIDPSNGDLAQIGTGVGVVADGRRSGVVVHPGGRFVYVANFDGNSVTMYIIDPTSGALSGGTNIAAGSLPFGITTDPSGRFVYVANLGGGVSAYTVHASTGALTAVAGSPFPAGAVPRSVTTDISGRFLFVANSSGKSITSYGIDSTTTPGALNLIGTTPVSTGEPHGLAADPGGGRLYASTRFGSTITTFVLDNNGNLTVSPPAATIAVDGPVSLAIDPSGRYLYTPNFQSNTVSMFVAAAGALTQGAPGVTSGWASSIQTTP